MDGLNNMQIIKVLVLSGFIIMHQFLFSQETGDLKGEVIVELNDLIPESRTLIHYPDKVNCRMPVRIIFYALPNGSTIEQTAGRTLDPNSSDKNEWKYDIQNIAAQTRFLRETDKSVNYVVVYLEAEQRAWTMHAAKYQNSSMLYCHLIDTICRIIAKDTGCRDALDRQEIMIFSHSGGGRLVFDYLKGVERIPSRIKRIAFLDSTYGYEGESYSLKLAEWLKRSKENTLIVLSYVDTTVRLDGKPVVSPTGGTAYKSHRMAEDLVKEGINLKYSADTVFRRYTGPSDEFCDIRKSRTPGDRIQIVIKENPDGIIYHTLLVEKNGFIHSALAGTRLENLDYKFWGPRSYSHK